MPTDTIDLAVILAEESPAADLRPLASLLLELARQAEGAEGRTDGQE